MKILITVPFTEEQKERLRAQMPEASYHFTDKVSLTDEEIREADIILGNVPVDRLANAPSPKRPPLNYSGADGYGAGGGPVHEVMLTNTTRA